jgi:hypothetical protein
MFVAQVVGQLDLHRALHEPLRQPREQTPGPDDLLLERAPVGEEKVFRAYDPEQVLLMAPVLSEWVPEGDLAHLVSDLVESGTLDLGAIYAAYVDERGYPPYDPPLMGSSCWCMGMRTR